MKFIFAAILLLIGSFFMFAGFLSKTSETILDTPGRIMSFIVGLVMVLLSLSTYYPLFNQ